MACAIFGPLLHLVQEAWLTAPEPNTHLTIDRSAHSTAARSPGVEDESLHFAPISCNDSEHIEPEAANGWGYREHGFVPPVHGSHMCSS